MTPTREQVIRLLIEAGHITCHPSNYTSDIDAAVIAYSAGRLKGLEEAVEAVLSKVSHPDDPNNSVWSAAYDCVANECAAAIEQLKEQTP